ncbi:MAG: biotin/lipoyl-binding protein, partial [Bacteroidetes bacterium]|nr:biotin/lipoyl-binding protein [Candidatus Cryptobacteroides excrementipullorum]
ATPAPQPAAAPAPAASGAGKAVTSPLPGVIVEISVKVGDSVKAGQQVAVLEAMKMENAIEADHAGTVTAIHVNKGDSVLEGVPIVTIG